MKVLVNAPFSKLVSNENGGEFAFFNPENIKKIESKFEVVWNKTDKHYTKEELIQHISDVDAIVTMWGSVKVDADVLAHAPKLKLLAHLCGTVRPFVSEELYDRGIKVIGANDTYFSESVAEGALVYTLMSLRRIDKKLQLLKQQKADGWYQIKKCRGLFDRTVGIVGFGAVGEHFARLLLPFRCKIKVHTLDISEEKLKMYNMERASMEEIFKTCDVISIHLPYNENTYHIINRELLQTIKKDALLLNTSRGSVIDEAALTDELKKGNFYAALDVFEKEPLPSESPLYEMDNVIIMPHSAGPTHDRYKYVTSLIIDEMYEYLVEGKPPKNEITKERAFSMTFR